MPTRLLLIALAGALGTLARVGIYAVVARVLAGTHGASLPIATLCVNTLGSLAFGLIWPWAETTGGAARMSVETRSVLLAGFMGAFTTFSTLAFETGEQMRRGAYGLAFMNMIANAVLGVGAFMLGVWLSRELAGAGTR